MFTANRDAENRHVVIRSPLDALKIKNYRTFTHAEIVDVNAAAQLLRDACPTITGSRKTVWPSLCEAMHVWGNTLVMDREEILHIERTSWRRHEQFYKQSLLGICLRLRWAREKWARRIFTRLCDQFCVVTAVELASVLTACMEENNSIVYIGFSLQTKRAYYGMVHERSPHERWQEHWRAVMQHGAGIATEAEKKYTYMASHGGAASWFFLPYISCGQVMPLHRLRDLEGKIIALYPNSLNRLRHSASLYKAVPYGGQAPVSVSKASDVQGRRKPGNSRVEMRVQAATADGAIQPTATDLNQAIAMCTAVSWHSTYPWSTIQSIRRFGGSIVVLYDGEGNSTVGLLKAALQTARHWGMGQRYLGMIQRREHAMNRPEDYDYLLALCKCEIPKSEACDLLVQ